MQKMIKSYVVTIELLASKAELGIDVNDQTKVIVNGACAHVGAMCLESPRAAIREFIDQVMIMYQKIQGTKQRRREVISLAVQTARNYMDGLSDGFGTTRTDREVPVGGSGGSTQLIQ